MKESQIKVGRVYRFSDGAKRKVLSKRGSGRKVEIRFRDDTQVPKTWLLSTFATLALSDVTPTKTVCHG